MKDRVDPHDRLRVFLLDGKPPEVRDDHDASLLEAAARVQGLTGLLAAAFEGAAEGPGRRLAAQLAEPRRALFARGLRQLDLAARVLALCEGANLRALPLKGAALSEALYTCPSHRPMADIDVLVLEDFPRACSLMVADGFAITETADHAVALRDGASGLVVELHHAWTSCPGLFPIDADAVWRRSVATGGLVARVPGPEDLLVHLALHAAFQHALRISLVQYLDFRRLAERVALDPESLRKAARAAQAEAALATALTTAIRVVGAPVEPLVAALGHRAWRGHDQPWRNAEVRPFELARLRLALATGRRGRLLAGTLGGGTSGGTNVVARLFGLVHRWSARPGHALAPGDHASDLAHPDLAAALARECLASLGHVRLTVTGACMEPLVAEGTQVEIANADTVRPRFGDVVLLQHPAGLRLHRLVWAPALPRWAWRTAGDRGPLLDPPITRDAVLGVVVTVDGQRPSRLRAGERAALSLWRAVRRRFPFAARVPALLLFALAALAVLGCKHEKPLSSANISVPYEVDTLDPHTKNTLSDFAMVSHIYEPLVTTDADMKLRPCLARLWENPDPSTWVFHLQRGARFHSGRLLRAQDVVYSIRRLLGSHATPLEMSVYVLYVSEVEAFDDETVRVRTTKPLSILLNKLRFVSIVPEGATDEDLALRPDGTGPYTVKRWDRGHELVLTRHRGYWGPAPSLDEVTFYLDRSPEEATVDIESGRSHLAQVNSRPAEARLRQGARVTIQSRPSLFTKFIGYDVARAVTPYAGSGPNPFRNLLVRQALNLAIDRRRLVAELTTGAVPTNQLVPASIFGFNPTIPPPAYDPHRARALLAQAGLPGGLQAALHVRKMYADAAHLVAAQLRPVGIHLEVAVLADEDFLARLRRYDSSLYLSRFGCPTGDATDILDNALHSRNPDRHMGMQNFGGYASAEVDAAIEKSAGVESVAERRAILESIMKRLMDDLAWIPLYVDEDVYAVDPRLRWTPRNDSFILAAEISPSR